MISDEEAKRLKDRIRELEEENKRLEKEFKKTKKQFEESKSKHRLDFITFLKNRIQMLLLRIQKMDWLE